jgi:hypothetical protein
VHPLQAGIFRRKSRLERRPGLPIEPMWVFYPRYAIETVRKYIALGLKLRGLQKIRKRIAEDPNAVHYTDEALAPVSDEHEVELELYSQTASAVAAVARERRVAGL